MPVPLRIDLISDTSTRPTSAMRKAMAEAEVGDEQRGEDPTVTHLCERVAEMLGHEAALFLPSGIMCNQVAVATHCRPGDEIIAAEASHIISSEGAGAAIFAGTQIRSIPCPRGIFSAADVSAALRPAKPKAPKSRLLEVEQTANRGGGSVWPLKTMQEVTQVAGHHALATHMDGARLMNAVVASGIPAHDFAGLFDSAWLDLSKGLGCPIGGVLVGSHEFIEEAWVWKHRFGGAMRQAGIIAAAGLHALDHHIERIAEDHANARLFSEQVCDIPGIALDPSEIETNLVFFDVEGTGFTAKEISDRLLDYGIRIGVESEFRMRLVTHLDIAHDDIVETAKLLTRVISSENP